MTLEAQLWIEMDADPLQAIDPDSTAMFGWVQIGKVVGIDTRVGRQQQLGRMEPGTIKVEVSDKTRLLDPHNTTSPYYGKIEEQRPVRIVAVDTAAGYGTNLDTPVVVAQGWLAAGGVAPVTYGYNDHRAQLTAVDLLGLVAAQPTESTALAFLLKNLKPSSGTSRTPVGTVQAFYKCDDLNVASSGDVLDSGPQAWTGAQFLGTWGQPPLDGDANGASWATLSTQWVTLPAGASMQVPFTIGFWVLCGQQAGGSYRTVLSQYNASNQIGIRVRVQDASAPAPGEIAVDLVGPSGSRVFYTGAYGTATPKRVDDGSAHFVVVSYDVGGGGGNGRFLLEVDGVTSILDNGLFAGIPSVRAGTPANGLTNGFTLVGTDSGGGFYLQGYVDDLVFMNGGMGLSGGVTPLYAAAAKGLLWELDYTDQRLGRVWKAIGLPSWRGIASKRDGTSNVNTTHSVRADWNNVQMTAMTFGGNPLDMLLEAAAAEDGELIPMPSQFYVGGSAQLWSMGGLQRPAAVSATWDDGTSGVGGAIPYADVALLRTTATNRWVVTRSGGTTTFSPPVAGVAQDSATFTKLGVRPQTVAISALAASVRSARATTLLNRTKVPLSLIRSMTVDVLSSTAARDAVLGAVLQDLWRVLAKPAGGGYTIDVNMRVVGIAHKITRRRWLATILLAPY